MVAIKDAGELDQSANLGDSREEALELFNKARALLKQRLSFFVWQGFFEPITALSLDNNHLILEAPTSFHRNWVIDHYMAELNTAIAESCGQEIKLTINNPAEGAKKLDLADNETKKTNSKSPAKPKIDDKKERNPEESLENSSQNVLPIVSKPEIEIPIEIASSNLNSSYSFDAFVQGPSNQMAYTAAMSVADQPGAQFSPLFLFGGVGLGKTHLLHAIGIRAKQQNPTLKVVYLSAERWVNSYIQAIRERRFDSFRNRYRNGCDILLIDDVQFLAGKDASQDEFFHTFNCLHEAKKQIVVTSDKYPHEIEGLEERLQTRLSWGLIADIKPPEMETRIAILQKKALALSVKIPDEVLNYLGANVTNSVRELEGALLRIAACSSILKEPMSLGQAKDILAPMIKRKVVVISWKKICEVVASYYGLKVSDLIGQSRQRQITFARQIAMTLCRGMLSMSQPEIGKAFGGRDHSTVLSSLRKIADLQRSDVSIQTVITKLENKISSMASL